MSEATSTRLGREFEAGAVLFREGERGELMFVVQSGSVRIEKSVSGRTKLLAVLGPGEFFGEMAILNGKPRTASAIANELTRCLLIDARTLEDMTANNSEIALRLIKKLARRLDSADSLVEVLLHQDPKARVLLALARHAEAFGEEIPGGTLVRATTADLAAEARVSESVASEMLVRVGRFDIAHLHRNLRPAQPPCPGDEASEQGSEEGPAVAETEGGEAMGIVVTDVARLRDFLEFLEPPSVRAGLSEPPLALTTEPAKPGGES